MSKYLNQLELNLIRIENEITELEVFKEDGLITDEDMNFIDSEISIMKSLVLVKKQRIEALKEYLAVCQ